MYWGSRPAGASESGLDDSDLRLETIVLVLFGTLSSLVYSGWALFSPTVSELQSAAETFWYHDTLAVAFSLPMIALLVFVHHRRREPWKRIGIARPAIIGDLALGTIAFFVVYAFSLVFGNVSEILLEMSQIPESHPIHETELWKLYPRPTSAPEYVFSLFSILIGAIEEELLFRGILIDRLRRIFRSNVKAVILGAVIFGSVHLYHGLVGAAGSLAMGLVLGTVFALSGRIWPCVAAHAAWNCWAIWTP